MGANKHILFRTPINNRVVYGYYKQKSPRPTIQQGGGVVLKER